jgi:LacI family transcriptional regulator
VAALEHAGLPAVADYYLSGIWSEAWGRDAVARLFDGKAERPDALFCGNDQIARGALEALRERSIGVPEDVAVVGFDNWDVMTLAARPPLSSIDMNLEALGREERSSGIRRLPCTLVVRQSSGTK